MLIYLYGSEEFLVKRKIKEIIEQYKKKHLTGLNIFRFDEENFTKEKLNEILKNNSLFAEKKLIILEKIKFSARGGPAEGWEPDIIWLVWDEKLKSTILKKADLSQEFKKLDRRSLVIWIKKETQNFGSEIQALAIDRLAVLYSENLWQLSNEIQKLSAYTNNISIGDVNLFSQVKEQANIFEAIDNLAEKNKKTALRIFQKLIAQGEDEIYLFSMIVSQWRNLIKIKNNAAASKISGMHPYVFQKTKKQAEKFSLEELKNQYKFLAELDFQIKTGQKDACFALDYFILKV